MKAFVHGNASQFTYCFSIHIYYVFSWIFFSFKWSFLKDSSDNNKNKKKKQKKKQKTKKNNNRLSDAFIKHISHGQELHFLVISSAISYQIIFKTTIGYFHTSPDIHQFIIQSRCQGMGKSSSFIEVFEPFVFYNLYTTQNIHHRGTNNRHQTIALSAPA